MLSAGALMVVLRSRLNESGLVNASPTMTRSTSRIPIPIFLSMGYSSWDDGEHTDNVTVV